MTSNRAFVRLVALTSECPGKRIRCKTWTIHVVQTQIRRHRLRHLIMVCTVCLNYRKLRLNEIAISLLSLHLETIDPTVLSVLSFCSVKYGRNYSPIQRRLVLNRMCADLGFVQILHKGFLWQCYISRMIRKVRFRDA